MQEQNEFQTQKEMHEAFERGQSYRQSGSKRISKTVMIGSQMGMSGTHNTIMGIGQKENPAAYSETAQEIKIRKAAEKRARRSGKQS
jgi:hypothetical protein